jgi:carbamoyltransferase
MTPGRYSAPMVILGIADNHDSGAAVCIDGRLVAAVNQERIDRVKLSGAFPWGAIDEALRIAGVVERDVDRIVVGTSFTPSAILRAMPERHHSARAEGQFSPWLHGYVVYQCGLRATGMHMLEVDACRRIIERRLKTRPFVDASIEMMDHHRAHAEGAYRTQGRPSCLVLTVDAMGDGTSATASIGRDGQLDHLWRQSGLASINTFYSRITERLGFTAIRHEGKVTGLAAYTDPPAKLVAHFQERVHFVAPGFSRVPVERIDRATDAFWGEIDRWSREEVASAAQRVLEEAVVPFVQHWVAETGCGHVAVAGGAFANVKLNQHVAALPEVKSLWVIPHMGDGGLAVGAAVGAAGTTPTTMSDSFLGPGFSAKECRQALATANIPRYRPRDPVAKVAKLLAKGQIVARFDGRMEWGPRALGNRSILVRPHDASINDSLNEKLGRSEFMPFAPVIRQEDADRWFVGTAQAPDAARFMTVCFPVTPEFSESCPAAVHVDGTARPQIVHETENPQLHALLSAVGEETGVPVLVNTSFNMHEEPLVCTPGDAIRAWQEAEIDALWLGDQLITR